jgi:hypothetical protein
MKLCEKQKVTIFIAILLLIFWLAFVFRVIDWKALVATLVGDGSMSILVYWLLRKSASNIKEAKRIEAKEKFCEWFDFFAKKWSNYKGLIESGTVPEPEINQPNTIADQMQLSFSSVKCEGFLFDLETGQRIQEIISRIHAFGFDLRKTMQSPRNRRTAKAIKELIEKGEAITASIRAVSEAVEKSLAIK